MKNINNYIKFIYFILIFLLFFKLLSVLNIIPMLTIIYPIIWFIIAIIGIFITHNDYNHFFNKKNKLDTLFIILLIYFIIYFSLGLIFGYSYNSYVNDSIKLILDNLYIYIIPVFFQEYIRGILCNYSNNKKKILIFISLMYIFLDLNFLYFKNVFSSGELFLKFLCLNLLPLIIREFVMTYLCFIGSYKLSLIYKIFMALFNIYIPILPKINFFLNGIIFTCFPALIYFIFDKCHEKEIKKIYYDYEKNKILDYVPILLILIIFICNSFGIYKYKMIAIMSDSMSPLYHKGDSVIVKKLTPEEKSYLEVGDIISYEDSNKNIIIHRIYNKIIENNNVFYITKGDNNSDVDLKKVGVENIKGKYIFNIKFIGYPRYIINDILSG